MSLNFTKTTILLYLFLSSLFFSQSIVINEVMSSNLNSFVDEFGEYPDWIELFNNETSQLNLSNFSLSDDKNNLRKWIFPSINVGAKSHLLILASGREISLQPVSWETVFSKGDICKFFLGTSEPNQDWKKNSFNDLNWQSGNTGIGYGDGDDRTEISAVNSLYIRKTFNVKEVNEIVQVLFNIDYDDGFVAYINGKEIARANLGNYGEVIPYDQPADQPGEAKLYQNEKLESFILNPISDYLVSGSNILAIQVHNYGSSSSDLTAIPFLTLGYLNSVANTFIANEIEAEIPNLHANIKISNGSETIYISNDKGMLIDSVDLPFLESNTSFGRYPDGTASWNIFSDTTPNSSNLSEGFIGQVQSPELNYTSGFYNSRVTLSLVNFKDGVSTYYTTDGSEPNTSSNLFINNTTVNQTTVLKVKSYSDNLLPSLTKTYTYFLNVEKDLPIISLSTNPENLWDYNEGIYVLGSNADKEFPFYGANFWEDWTRPANFEYFDLTENIYLASPVYIKIYGAYSRAYGQKSISVFPTTGNKLENVFFPNEEIDELSSIVLRNSGNDWQYTMFRDGFFQDLAASLNLDRLAFRPAILYLNGEYWGIHNIREKINLNYIADHYKVKKSDIDLLELFGEVIDGDNGNFFELVNYIETNDLSSNSVYESVSNQIEISNFIDYNLFEIFIDNTDWPGNNNKYWRPKVENGKWRWILFDTDFGFGLYNSNDYAHNTLSFALEENGPEIWPNPPWSTFLLRNLLKNENFKNEFISRYSDLTNSVFKPDNVKSKISKAKSVIENEINDHINKWRQFSYTSWESNIDQLNNFANRRLPYLNRFFQEEFKLDDLKFISLQNSNIQAGIIKINSLIIEKDYWSGSYFSGSKIKLKAIPNPGYRFVGWTGVNNSTEESIEIDFNSELNIRASFESDNGFKKIVINEINYNSYSNFDTEDWIELYNNSDESVDLSNWQFTDEIDTSRFIFPSGTSLESHDYLIITRDSTDFISLNGNENYLIGNFNFGLSNSGELIRLLDANSNIIDSVRFDDKYPWPKSADGEGNTLELINPDFNNGNYINWSNSTNFGTPGKRNSNFSLTEVNEEEQLPKKLNLSQNYPNPFNPTTNIEYSVPPSLGENLFKVKLIVYDLLGREIKTLVDKKQNVGNYKVSFNGKDLSSGIYFYKLYVNQNILTKKMILIK